MKSDRVTSPKRDLIEHSLNRLNSALHSLEKTWKFDDAESYCLASRESWSMLVQNVYGLALEEFRPLLERFLEINVEGLRNLVGVEPEREPREKLAVQLVELRVIMENCVRRQEFGRILLARGPEALATAMERELNARQTEFPRPENPERPAKKDPTLIQTAATSFRRTANTA